MIGLIVFAIIGLIAIIALSGSSGHPWGEP